MRISNEKQVSSESLTTTTIRRINGNAAGDWRNVRMN